MKMLSRAVETLGRGARRRGALVTAGALAALGVAALPAAAGALDQSQTNFGSAKGYVGTWNNPAASDVQQAQTFTSGLSGILDRVDLPVRVVGDPATDLVVEIRTTAGGEATTTVIGSATVPQAGVPAFAGSDGDFTTFSFLSIPLTSPAPVSAGVAYAIVLRATGSAGDVYAPDGNRYEWAGVVGDAYAPGHHTTIVGGAPDPDTFDVDLAFRTYVGTTTASAHFLQPLDESSESSLVINEGSNSRTIPVKVQLTAGGAAVTGSDVPTPAVTLGTPVQVTCAGGSSVDAVETYASSPSTGSLAFSWNNGGFWELNLSVKSLGLTIGSCYRLDVYVNGAKVTNAFAVYRPKSK